jgi:hypothetical protein
MLATAYGFLGRCIEFFYAFYLQNVGGEVQACEDGFLAVSFWTISASPLLNPPHFKYIYS